MIWGHDGMKGEICVWRSIVKYFNLWDRLPRIREKERRWGDIYYFQIIWIWNRVPIKESNIGNKKGHLPIIHWRKILWFYFRTEGLKGLGREGTYLFCRPMKMRDRGTDGFDWAESRTFGHGRIPMKECRNLHGICERFLVKIIPFDINACNIKQRLCHGSRS